MSIKPLWRLTLVLGLLMSAPVMAELSPKQLTQLSVNCLQCHASPTVPAPMLGDSEAWADIAAQSDEEIYINVVQGKKGMPPMGLCSSCEQEDFKALINYMLESSGHGR